MSKTAPLVTTEEKRIEVANGDVDTAVDIPKNGKPTYRWALWRGE
jgi:hypothetical protein